jgi:serine/threonine protein kinase
MEVRVGGGRFIVKKRIGAGSFGEIFLGEDEKTKEPVAIKLEQIKCRAPQLFYESKLYLILSSGVCIPHFHWYGTESSYNILVIELLDKSLEDLFNICNKRFSLKTVLMIVDQTINCLEYIHNKNFIHRDIKPDNFMIGRGSAKGQIFMIDFGLAKKYRDPKTHEHLRFTPGKSLTGTARYASINALSGYEQSRRDDLEAIGYVWIYFLLGILPWQGLQGDNEKQKYEKILKVKKEASLDVLLKDVPHEFHRYLESVRGLGFDEEPRYAEYRAMFRDLFIRKGYVYDYQYDWVPLLTEEEAEVKVVRKNSIKASQELPNGFPPRISSVPNFKKVQPQKAKKSSISKMTTEPPKKGVAPTRGSFVRKK